MIAVALLALSALPAFGSPEFLERARIAWQTGGPIVEKVTAASRNGDAEEFGKYVSEGAVAVGPGDRQTDLTVHRLRDLATRCSAGESQGLRLLEEGDETSVYWTCPGEAPSPMTRLLFKNGKIVRAGTGPAVVYTLPAPEHGSR